MYVDDVSVGGHLNGIYEWSSKLCSKGPASGYYPEPSKSLCLLMTDISLKLKDCMVHWVIILLQVIVSWAVISVISDCVQFVPDMIKL